MFASEYLILFNDGENLFLISFEAKYRENSNSLWRLFSFKFIEAGQLIVYWWKPDSTISLFFSLSCDIWLFKNYLTIFFIYIQCFRLWVEESQTYFNIIHLLYLCNICFAALTDLCGYIAKILFYHLTMLSSSCDRMLII